MKMNLRARQRRGDFASSIMIRIGSEPLEEAEVDDVPSPRPVKLLPPEMIRGVPPFPLDPENSAVINVEGESRSLLVVDTGVGVTVDGREVVSSKAFSPATTGGTTLLNSVSLHRGASVIFAKLSPTASPSSAALAANATRYNLKHSSLFNTSPAPTVVPSTVTVPVAVVGDCDKIPVNSS